MIGQRTSKQRDIILEELKCVTCHPTADELYEMVRKKVPNISLGTVYRNLDLLSKNGIVLKIDSGGKKRFDGTPTPHPHMRCVCCGKVEDLMLEFEPPVLNDGQKKGFHISSCHLEYHGLCPDCVNKD